eukprot:gene6238-6306_t
MKYISTLLMTAMLSGAGQNMARAEDIGQGEKIFTKCMQCHRIGEGAANFYGPVLNGVVGRKAGSVPGYNYSEANKASGIVWTEAALRSYLKQPKHDVPGTNMTFVGLQNEEDINNVIAYLRQFGPDGKKL